jgi:hypothetical protein
MDFTKLANGLLKWDVVVGFDMTTVGSAPIDRSSENLPPGRKPNTYVTQRTKTGCG